MNKSSSETTESKNNYQKINLNDYRMSISKMNYENSLAALDEILNKLQHEHVPIEELNNYYIQGSVLVEHCKNLLSHIEQEVLEISLDEN